MSLEWYLVDSQQENRDLKLMTCKALHSVNNHMILEEDTEL